MNITIYRKETKRTLPDLGSNKDNYCHMVLGLSGEIGELVELIGTELSLKVDKIGLSEELGDLYWYLSNYCNMRDLPLPEEPYIEFESDMCMTLLIISISNLVDLIKKYIAYNKEIDRVKELQYTYDIYCALQLFEKAYDLDGNKIRAMNIGKLRVRYPEKFTDELAINRNLEEERKFLENNKDDNN